MFKNALGMAIKTYRIDRNLTQRQLAEKSFMAHNYLSDVERGVKSISSEFLECLATALDVPAYELVLEAGYLMADLTIPNTVESLLDEHSPIHIPRAG
jgi:transcriptional regulator with XRE-family HTH domain